MTEKCTALALRTGTVYMLTSPSGKSYVGQTRRAVKQRLWQHEHTSGCPALYRAISKYGVGSFSVVELMRGVPLNLLNTAEGMCVALMETIHPLGYNLGSGGNACIPISQEVRDRLSSSGTGRKASKATLEKRSASLRSALARPEVREKMRLGHLGIQHTEATKRRISELAKLRFTDPSERAACGERNRRRVILESTRAKLSVISRQRWSPELALKVRASLDRPEVRLRMAEAQRGRKHPEAVKEKIRASLLARADRIRNSAAPSTTGDG